MFYCIYETCIKIIDIALPFLRFVLLLGLSCVCSCSVFAGVIVWKKLSHKVCTEGLWSEDARRGHAGVCGADAAFDTGTAHRSSRHLESFEQKSQRSLKCNGEKQSWTLVVL